MRLSYKRNLVLAGACLALVSGCTKPTPTKLPTVADAMPEVATCKAAKDPLNPIIVEWPATNKTQLQSKTTEGVVVVSYIGCNLKVLTGCSAPGSYAFRGVLPAHDRIKMSSESELSASLPLGFASLRGELASGSSLELDFVAIGERAIREGPQRLEGRCDGATHYVRAMTLGAFQLDVLAHTQQSGGVAVAGVSGSGADSDRRTALRGWGDVKQCGTLGAPSEADAAANKCDAVVQLSLEPLGAAALASRSTPGVAPGAVAPVPAAGGGSVDPARGWQVSFEPEKPEQRWTLFDYEHHPLCPLPCERTLGQHSGYYLQLDPVDDDEIERVDVPDMLTAPFGRSVRAVPLYSRGNGVWPWLVVGTGAFFALAGGGASFGVYAADADHPSVFLTSGILVTLIGLGAVGGGVGWGVWSRDAELETEVAGAP